MNSSSPPPASISAPTPVSPSTSTSPPPSTPTPVSIPNPPLQSSVPTPPTSPTNLPPPQPSPSPYAVPESVPIARTKTKPKLRTLLISIAAVVLFGGAGAFAYLGVYLPSQPENVVKAMLTNSLQTQIYKADGKLSIKDNTNDVILNSAGAFDFSDIHNPKIQNKFTLDAYVTDITFDVVFIDHELYFKPDGITGLAEILQAQFGASAQDITPITSLFDKVFGYWFVVNESVIKEFVDFSQLTTAELDELKTAAQDINFFEIEEVLADEAVRGSMAYHYRLRTNVEGIMAYLDKIKGKTIAGDKISDDVIEELKDLDSGDLDGAAEQFEVWVYKDTKQLAKVYDESPDDMEGFEGTFSVEFYDYNVPVEITKPAEAKSMLELTGVLQSAIQGIFGSRSNLGFPSAGQLELLPGDNDTMPTTLGEILYR